MRTVTNRRDALIGDCVGIQQRPEPRDLPNLEAYLRDLKRVSDDVLALGDGMGGQPWFRLHAELVQSGIWAALKPCSRAVLVTLAALCDRRKRVTIAGVERVAGLSGLSVPRTLFAYRELRDFGLIWRRRVALKGKQPYMSGLANPHRWHTE